MHRYSQKKRNITNKIRVILTICLISINFNNDVVMDKKRDYLRIIVSNYGFQDYYKENRILINGIAELDSMVVTENFDCSKILCVCIEEPVPKTQIELTIHRFADKLNNAGVIGAYNVHPMGVPLDSSGVRFHDVYSNDNTVKQFRYVIDYVSVK